MANPLDLLFQAAEALPVPVPGDNQVQVQISAALFPAAPGGTGIMAQGIMLFTPAKNIVGKGTLLREPAFFSGSAFSGSPGSFETKITLTAPNILGPLSDYNLAIQSTAVHGNFTPTAVQPNNASYLVFAAPFVVITLTAPISISF
jgi:hypothetical protein